MFLVCYAYILLICLKNSHQENIKSHKIVTYWGQNAVYNELKSKEFWEKDLSEFCSYNYDTIILSFVNTFFDEMNKDKMPGMNFAFHCETPLSSDYKTLFRCKTIENGVKECQKRGKNVLISLGGAVGNVGFKNEAEAKLFAYRVYHLFLEGSELPLLRPFGSAVLNGIDLDIESGDYKYYSLFVQEIKRLEKTGSQSVFISAAPQCPYPDYLLGPSAEHLLGDVPNFIDEIYVQFYNNWCNTGNTVVFDDHMVKWLNYSRDNKGPKIYIGIPANIKASGNPQHYRTPQELAVIYSKYKEEPRFGGVMIWDASFDQNNLIAGKHYSKHISDMFNMQNNIQSLAQTTQNLVTISSSIAQDSDNSHTDV
ncbi:uncharacterized protein LOC100198091 isoform X2 [Hydra vulgaris]|uniref:chitinase n=1 Tax=Hydra vulgaris TaxID=6087 RepID=A0ABM4D4Y3_HYDVU